MHWMDEVLSGILLTLSLNMVIEFGTAVYRIAHFPYDRPMFQFVSENSFPL